MGRLAGARIGAESSMKVLSILVLGGALALAGCATPGRNVYPRGEAQSAWDVKQGTVVAIDTATIEGRRTQVGRIGGGLIGYETGRTVGEGAGSRIAGAVGAVAGAVAGEAVEERATRQNAMQITVEMDGGRTLAVVQPGDQQFAVGERVKVYTRGGQARVGKL